MATESKPLLPSGCPPTNTLLSNLKFFSFIGIYILLATITYTSWVYVHNSAMSGGGVSFDYNDPKVFNAHPLFMLLTFVFMTLGRTAFVHPLNTTPSRRKTLKSLHGLTFLIAIALSSVALWAVWASHDQPHPQGNKYISNLYSLHSWVGIGMFSLMLGNFLIGSGAFGLQLVSPEIRAALMPFHRLLGNVIYYGWGATILLGIQEKEGFQGCDYSSKLTEPEDWAIWSGLVGDWTRK